jgi:redox-sensitive bicupin YhaK (pirin superfamily)
MNIEILPARPTELGSLKILRALPRRGRRTVGPWCFMDRFGPLQFDRNKAMDVAPHPHIGLQTVSWLLAGEVLHKDSLGCEAAMRAGQLNLMTAGNGIAHSEETPDENSGRIDGIQLWVALPDRDRHIPPQFDHYSSLPTFNVSSATVTLIAGKMFDQLSPARTFSPIIGAEISFPERQAIDLPLDRNFEHAVFSLHSDAHLNGVPLQPAALHYIPPGLDEVRLEGFPQSRLLLIGGPPFREPIVMWWNFVARSFVEMDAARQAWIRHERFGEVKGYKGSRLDAPELSSPALPNPL